MKTAVKNWLHGAVRSWTVWFSALLAGGPLVLEALQANWSAVAPFVPDGREKLILQAIGLVVFLLRLRTTASIGVKGEVARTPPAAGV